MGKYGEALGIWELKIGGADLKVRPRKGDNLELMNIMKKKDEDNFLSGVYSLLIKIIERDTPPQTNEEKTELEEYVEFNLMDLFKEMMIKFKWATPDQINKMESDAQKKAN